MRLIKACMPDEVCALEESWRALDSASGNPLAHFDWWRTSLAAFADEEAVHVVAIGVGQRLLAAAPLVRKTLGGVRRLFLAGQTELAEPGDLAVADERARRRLIRALAWSGLPLVWERMLADSPTLAALRRAYRGGGFIIVRPRGACPYIDLDETWLEPEQHLNSGRRADLRRARRKAEQLGALGIEIHTPDLGDLSELLDTACEVEARSWKGEAGTALAHDAHRAMFFRQYAHAACVAGTLRICFLRIGDRVAAMQLAIEAGGGFWLLKVGYDPRFAECSPGMLLVRETIRYAVEAGATRYEFLGTSAPWTRVWTQTERATVAVSVYPLGLRGLAALAVDAARGIGNAWRRRQCKS